MDFSEKIREIRNDSGLTQEEMAARLGVTRQAVSNWENGKNLPDIEILIDISRTFSVSLDELILGENGGSDMSEKNNENAMAEKLIRDGGENRRAHMKMVAAVAGALLMIAGAACFVIKGMSVEYIDSSGILHENFFLLPIGWALIIAGAAVILTAGIRSALAVRRERRRK